MILTIIAILLAWLVVLVWVGFSHACDRLDDILKELRKDPNAPDL